MGRFQTPLYYIEPCLELQDPFFRHDIVHRHIGVFLDDLFESLGLKGDADPAGVRRPVDVPVVVPGPVADPSAVLVEAHAGHQDDVEIFRFSELGVLRIRFPDAVLSVVPDGLFPERIRLHVAVLHGDGVRQHFAVTFRPVVEDREVDLVLHGHVGEDVGGVLHLRQSGQALRQFCTVLRPLLRRQHPAGVHTELPLGGLLLFVVGRADVARHVKRTEGQDRFPGDERRMDRRGDILIGVRRAAEAAQVVAEVQRIKRPGAVRCHAEELLRVRADALHHRFVVFIGEDAGQDDELFVSEIFRQVFRHHFRALRVVAAVEQEQRFPSEDLEAGRPAGLRKTVGHGVVGDRPSPFPQRRDRRQGGGRVVELVVAEQRSIQREAVPFEGLTGQVMGHRGHIAKVDEVERGAPDAAELTDDAHDFRRAVVADDVAPVLDDAALGHGDLLEGVPEVLGVLEADVRDDRHFRRVDDVGTVEGAAHADFQDHDVAALLFEVEHADGRHQFELARMVLHGVRFHFHPLRDGGEVLPEDVPAVHLQALFEAEDMGRCIEPGLITRFPQDRRQHGAGAPLAVAARHVDEFQVFLRVSEAVQQLHGPVEAEPRGAPGIVFNVGDCFLIGHLQILHDVAVSVRQIETQRFRRAVLRVFDADDVRGLVLGHLDGIIFFREKVLEVFCRFRVVVPRIVRHEDDASHDVVELREQQFLRDAVLQIVFSQEEDVRVVGECAAVEAAAEDGVDHRVAGRGDLPGQSQFVEEVAAVDLVGVRADAAGVEDAETGAERSAAAEDQFVAAGFPKEVDAVGHELSAVLPETRVLADAVEEVEFDEVIAPLVQDDIEEVLDVLPGAGVVDVERIGEAPAEVGEDAAALLVFDEPVRVLFRHFGLRCSTERREPDAGFVAFGMDGVGAGFHAVGELLFVRDQPVSGVLLIAVVDLEDLSLLLCEVQSVQVAVDDLLVDLAEIVVPGGVAREPFKTGFLYAEEVEEVGVECLLVLRLTDEEVVHEERVPRLQRGAVHFSAEGESPARHVDIEDGEPVPVGTGAPEFDEMASLFAEIGECERMEASGDAVLGVGVVAHLSRLGLHELVEGDDFGQAFGHIVPADLFGRRPGLEAVQEEQVVVPEGPAGGQHEIVQDQVFLRGQDRFQRRVSLLESEVEPFVFKVRRADGVPATGQSCVQRIIVHRTSSFRVSVAFSRLYYKGFCPVR